MKRRKEFSARPAPLAEEVRRFLAAAPVRAPLSEIGVAAARAQQARLAATRGPGPEMAAVRDFDVPARRGPLPVRLYFPVADPPAILLYFHGGGWVMGGIEDSDPQARRIAEATGCALASVDYRLAPEHPFPAALDDALDAWGWLVDEAPHLASAPVLGIAGDSAGGNVAAGATIALRDAGIPLPTFQILVYPVLSPVMDSDSYRDQADGPILTAADMAWFWDCYAPDPPTRADPRAAPLLAPDLTGLPPALIIAGQCDPLRDEAADYAERLRTAGVPVRHLCFAGMPHGFYKSADLLAGGRAALAEVAAFVRARLAMRAGHEEDSKEMMK